MTLRFLHGKKNKISSLNKIHLIQEVSNFVKQKKKNWLVKLISKIETGIEEGGGRQENRSNRLVVIISQTSFANLRKL